VEAPRVSAVASHDLLAVCFEPLMNTDGH
jgi:hypothetical protein